jgi:hypothetical protein
LLFIEDGNPDWIEFVTGEQNQEINPKSIKLANFEKLSMLAKLIGEVRQSQKTVYCLHELPHIQQYLQSDLMSLKEEQIENCASRLEPNESTDASNQQQLIRTRSQSFGQVLSERQKQKNFEEYSRTATSGHQKSFVKK